MNNQEPFKDNPASKDLYRLKEAHRRNEARRPISEKMATVARLRDFQHQLEQVRQTNRAKRAAKQIKIEVKTR
jgi:hypothetical protein